MKNARKFPFARADRLVSVIREEVSMYMGTLDTEYPISVTHVLLSPDCRHATVYVREKFDLSSLEDADEAKKEAIMKDCNRNLKRLREHLGRALKLKFTPNLKFEFDQGLEIGEHLDDLLKNNN